MEFCLRFGYVFGLNWDRRDKYICKDACQYIRKCTYIYIYIREQQHIYKDTNIQKPTNVGTHANKQGPLIHIYPTPPLGQDMTQGQFLSGV